MNSSSKTDEYVKGFRLTENDEKIIMFFINNNNEPTYPAEIERKTDVTRKTVGKRCKILKDQGILLSERKLAKGRGYTDYYYLTKFVDVLNYLNIYKFNGFFDQIMRTDYYRTQIDNLIERFDNTLKSAGHKTLTKDEKEVLQICLKYSWTGLRVVLGLTDYEYYSKEFISQYKHTMVRHWEEGVGMLLPHIDEVINNTKTVGEKDKPILKKEIDKKAVSLLDAQIEIIIKMLEENIITFLFEDFMRHDSYLYQFSRLGRIEQLESDIEKLGSIQLTLMNEFMISNGGKMVDIYFQQI